MANVEEAHLLEIVLKAGALKAPVQIIEERIVGPSLGEDSIKSGLTASFIAFLFVVFFMIIYYNKGGIIADFAVLLNVFLIISTLSAFGGTLSLPGISGIILTIGMAVDANILIFERIREELWKGRSLKSAVDEGFGKAMNAIIDSNITTFITGLILYFFGTGPIQGFAMTLMIGIIFTLFTGVLVSRAIIEILLSRGITYFNFGQPKAVNE
jgi:SecD/SecF fusion protein